VYAWQIHPGSGPQFLNLPPIHTFGKELVDWIAVLGGAGAALNAINTGSAKLGVEYRHVETLPYFAYEGIRPELFWHSFTDRPVQDPKTEAVHLYRKTKRLRRRLIRPRRSVTRRNSDYHSSARSPIRQSKCGAAAIGNPATGEFGSSFMHGRTNSF
jgi:hypothetical protein